MPYLARYILDYQFLLVQSEVLAGSLYEVVPASDDLAVEGIDDGVGLLQEPVDPADFLEVEIPLGRVFDDDADIDVLVLAGYSPGDFLALGEGRST